MSQNETSALDAAVAVGHKAAARGFDWECAPDALDKVLEEAEELREAIDGEPGAPEIAEELGDLLFAICNVARMLGLSPEDALLSAVGKFERRFEFLLGAVERDGLQPEQLPLPALEEYWQQAKAADPP